MKRLVKRMAWMLALIGMTVLWGCGQSSVFEVGPDDPEPVAEPARLEGDVELVAAGVGPGFAMIETAHEAYGDELLPLGLLARMAADIQRVPSAGDLISFQAAGMQIDVESGTTRYYVDGAARDAAGPSFDAGGEEYVHASVLADVLGARRLDDAWFIGEWVAREDLVPATGFAGRPGFMSLINKEHGLAREQTGLDLINLNETYPDDRYLKSDMMFNEEASHALAALLDELTAVEGMETVYLVSTYRTFDYQQGIYERKIRQYMDRYGYDEETAAAEAGRIVAVPGTSEHQSGLAVDFTSQTLVDQGLYLEQAFLETPAGSWIRDNAARFGFILRYPQGTEETTGIMQEAWHYRYVGQPHSHQIMSRGLVLETYIEDLKERGSVVCEDADGGRWLVLYVQGALADRMLVGQGVSVSDSNEGGLILSVPLSAAR